MICWFRSLSLLKDSLFLVCLSILEFCIPNRTIYLLLWAQRIPQSSAYLNHTKNWQKVNFASTIEKELESYVNDFPLKTAECLELIFKSEKNTNQLHAIRGITTKNILRALLQSRDQAAVEKAESLVHFLGTLGFNEYGDLSK